MKALVQRVARARVVVGTRVTGEIRVGLLVLLGVTHRDDEAEARWLAGKVAGLRVFGDATGRMSLDVRDVNGGVLVVPQFTLYADTRHGRRPEFTAAAHPGHAEPLIRRFCLSLTEAKLQVEHGVFGAHMSVELINDGPVTLMLETPANDAP